jgi:glyoxylate reductase
MAGPTVYVTRRIPINGLDRLRQACEVRLWDSDDVVPRDVLLREVADAEGLLCLLTDRIDAELLDHAPKLKVAANLAVGFDNFDVAELTRRGVVGCNTPGVLTETTADFTWALLMAAARMIPQGIQYVKQGRWTTWGPLLLRGQDIHHATLGIVGLGRIGQEVAKRARGFDMTILYHDAYRREDLEREHGYRYVDMDTLLRESDFVTLHVDLNPQTRGMLNAAAFNQMKPTAIVVNAARGPIIDPDALYAALKNGEIAGAALDVTQPEPIPLDSPLLTLDNCLVVPHIASATMRTRDEMSDLAARNILAVLNGERPLTPVNPQVLEQPKG